MSRHAWALVALFGATLMSTPAHARPGDELRGFHDHQRAPEFARRALDWRNGTVVYQVMVDRFAPSASLAAKRVLYPAPRVLKAWTDQPRAGHYVTDAGVWSHELEFWGGDLSSLRGKLDYLQGLGIETLYLNPIFLSLTNHKYDTWDYMEVDPALGTREELRALVKDLHARGMRLMLDGVFNHLGRQSPMFQAALARPDAPERAFFKWRPDGGHVGWMDVANLPELNLEDARVQDYLFARPDAVMQRYVRQDGIDGWRLDVAFDLGFRWLARMTEAVHGARRDTAVIGEIWNYPEEWSPAVDGVMNMHGRAILLALVDGTMRPEVAGRMWERMVADAGIEPMLKSWLVLDNHDTPRLATRLPEPWAQQMARVLQLTLPGSAALYYGSELGLTGGEDPEPRGPMPWEQVQAEPPMLTFHRSLLQLRRASPALRYGDYRRLEGDRLFAFLRRTAAVRDTVVVAVNPGATPVRELVQLRESKLQDASDLVDVFSGARVRVSSGMAELSLPAHGWTVLRVDAGAYPGGYQRYDRMP